MKRLGGMKIQFQGVHRGSSQGPSKFADRLADSFERKGHAVIYEDTNEFDIGLVFIKNWFPFRKEKKYVQRLDGIYVNTQPNHEGLTHETGNTLIKSTYDQVDAHIFQSQFTSLFVRMHFDKRDVPSAIINNGIEIPTEQDRKKKKLSVFDKYDKLILSVSNWRPNKRPLDNISTFFHIKEMVDYPVGMVMIGPHYGNLAIPYNKDLIMIKESIKQENLAPFYQSADYFFHMTHMDNCPNAVIEALAHKTPVLCTDNGGTWELLRGTGTQLIASDLYYGPQDTYNLEPLDCKKAAEQVVNSWDRKWDFAKSDQLLNIDNVADRYLQFFEEIL
jgi:glycosyltransferase involved in cell wall biosynthesis